MVNLSDLQQHVFKILIEYDRICRIYGLCYSLEGGTLLGAVKYKDYVPWDDDIDVIMLREDYDKFLKIAPQELPQHYFLQTYNNVKQFPLNYAKLCSNSSFISNYAYSHLHMNHGLFVDIFPIDNVKLDKLEKQSKIVSLLTGARTVKLKIKFDGKSSLMKSLCKKIVSVLPLKTINSLIDKTCKKYNNIKTDHKYEICNRNRKFKPLNSEIYEEYIELEFRGKNFFAVKEYDLFLKSRFGENYMSELPAEEERKPSHRGDVELINA